MHDVSEGVLLRVYSVQKYQKETSLKIHKGFGEIQ